MRRLNTGYQDGQYGLPSGHLEDNESISHGLCREVKEEIGVFIKPSDLSLVHVMHRKETDIRVDLFFVATKIKGTPVNAEPDKCDDLQWFRLDKLPKNTIGYVKQAINNYLKGKIYSEIGWN